MASTGSVQSGLDGDPPIRRFSFAPVRRPGQVNGAVRTRFVGLLKFTLPMLALALVVAVIVWPGSFSDDSGFQLSFVTLKRGDADRLTMLSPRYLGTDSQNQPFIVTASVAEQDPADTRQVTLKNIQADMTFEDGSWFSMLAAGGIYHQGRQTLRLAGDINIFSDAGYELHTEAVNVDLAAGAARTDSVVTGQGPFGSVRADRLEAEQRGRLLRFSGNVRLVIEPDAGVGK
jgi:lipopolysaccharide export system protein LptC